MAFGARPPGNILKFAYLLPVHSQPSLIDPQGVGFLCDLLTLVAPGT